MWGLSAGGHLASMLATRGNDVDGVIAATPWLRGDGGATARRRDAVDAEDARPAFAVLAYPVISLRSDITHMKSRNALLGDGAKGVEAAAAAASRSAAETDALVAALSSER